eukprot:SAG25_NODE_699_length_5883_cov_3.452282_7_plen_69_part_00
MRKSSVNSSSWLSKKMAEEPLPRTISPPDMVACRVAPLALDHRDVDCGAARSSARVRGVTGRAGGRRI